MSARDSRRTRPLDRRVVDARSTLDCRFPAVAMISRQVPSGAALAGAPLEDRVKGHSDFFDRLVELIPAKYYVPDEQNPEWSKFNKSKGAKAAAKQAAKENSKKALRAKLNPVNAQSTLEKIRSKELGLSASARGEDDDDEDDEENESDFEDDVSDDDEGGSPSDDSEEDEPSPPAKKKAADAPPAPATPAGAPPTAAGWSVGESGGNRLEELRERLQAKIAASRMARKAEESKEKAAKAREWREEKKMTKAEKKRKERAEVAVGAALDGKKSGKRRAEEDADAAEDEDDLQFGRVEVDGKVGGPPRKKRADKQTLLRKALDQRKEIADAGGEETEAGKKVAERYSWDAALARAGGEKVLDDPKLLQKSVKNEARMKKRSTQKWEARVARTEEQMAAKQKKRKDSLKNRANAKVERRIEKREKKRNRPGFEGRSQGPINK